MISRSQKNEKSSPPPQREPLRGGGGGCQLILDLVGQIPLLKKEKKIGNQQNNHCLFLFLRDQSSEFQWNIWLDPSAGSHIIFPRHTQKPPKKS